MTNVIAVNFAQRRADKELSAKAPDRPGDYLLGNLIFTLEAYGCRVLEPTKPEVTLCPKLNLWRVEVTVESCLVGNYTRMAFWYDDGYITHSTTCPASEFIDPAKAERVEEC